MTERICSYTIEFNDAPQPELVLQIRAGLKVRQITLDKGDRRYWALMDIVGRVRGQECRD